MLGGGGGEGEGFEEWTWCVFMDWVELDADIRQVEAKERSGGTDRYQRRIGGRGRSRSVSCTDPTLFKDHGH